MSSACSPREDSEVFRPFDRLKVVPSKVEGRAPERERVGVGPHAQ
jgi:hypothetical protein